jgi:hypothetical protein
VNTPAPESLRAAVSHRRMQVPAVALGVLVLAAGCASGGGSTAGSAAQTPRGASPTSAAGASGAAARPGTTGSISAVNPSSIYVQNTQAGQVTVNFTGATTFSQTVPATAAALKVGQCVTATSASTTSSNGASPAPVTSLTATSVTVTQASGSCTRGAGGNFGGLGSARPSGAPGFPRPSGSARRGNFPRASFGTVASVGNGSFVITSTRNSKSTKVTVTTTSATTYRQLESATKANLKVELCATAIGATDDTGAIAARSIALSTPAASGCSAGFGGGRFGGGGGTGGTQ